MTAHDKFILICSQNQAWGFDKSIKKQDWIQAKNNIENQRENEKNFKILVDLLKKDLQIK